MQIEKKIIDKIANELKTAEILEEYFKINDFTLKTIYEDLINFFLKIDKTWKFADDLKIMLQDDSDFLLDKILQWYSIEPEKLYHLYLKKLWLKLNKLDNKWIFLFQKEIFQNDKIINLFKKLFKLDEEFKQLKYIIAKKVKNIIWESSIKLLENEVIEEIKKDMKDLDYETIKSHYWYVIENLLTDKIIVKYKTLILNNILEIFEWIEKDELKKLIQQINSWDYLDYIKKSFSNEIWEEKINNIKIKKVKIDLKYKNEYLFLYLLKKIKEELENNNINNIKNYIEYYIKIKFLFENIFLNYQIKNQKVKEIYSNLSQLIEDYEQREFFDEEELINKILEEIKKYEYEILNILSEKKQEINIICEILNIFNFWNIYEESFLDIISK